MGEVDQDANPFRYSGEYFDTETGFVYLRARYYDPATSRMLSEDPYWHPGNMIYGDNPSTYPIPNIAAIMQSSNKYVFCGNNPIRYHDPSGLYYLEKGANGQVYAVIESGDTLSAIAYAEVRDASAYTKMTGVSDFNNISVGQRVNFTGIYNSSYPNPNLSAAATTGGDSTANSRRPSTGEPGSTYTNPKGDSRTYGPDGKPETDVDQPHGHNPNPHVHRWPGGVRGPAEPIPSDVGWGIVVVGGIITIIELVAWYYGMPVDLPGN